MIAKKMYYMIVFGNRLRNSCKHWEMDTLKQFIKRTPLYPPIEALRANFRRREAIREWRAMPAGVPPPPEFKHDTIIAYARRFRLCLLIETGTYFGDTIAATRTFFSEVYSIELSPELYSRAKDRFAADPGVHLIQGDSGRVLPTLLPTITRRPLFWLDGHYSEGYTARGETNTPIRQELEAITALCPNGVVLIDDARHFDGTHSYPTLAELQSLVRQKAPQWSMDVKDGIIRLHDQT